MTYELSDARLQELLSVIPWNEKETRDYIEKNPMCFSCTNGFAHPLAFITGLHFLEDRARFLLSYFPYGGRENTGDGTFYNQSNFILAVTVDNVDMVKLYVETDPSIVYQGMEYTDNFSFRKSWLKCALHNDSRKVFSFMLEHAPDTFECTLEETTVDLSCFADMSRCKRWHFFDLALNILYTRFSLPAYARLGNFVWEPPEVDGHHVSEEDTTRCMKMTSAILDAGIPCLAGSYKMCCSSFRLVVERYWQMGHPLTNALHSLATELLSDSTRRDPVLSKIDILIEVTGSAIFHNRDPNGNTFLHILCTKEIPQYVFLAYIEKIAQLDSSLFAARNNQGKLPVQLYQQRQKVLPDLIVLLEMYTAAQGPKLFPRVRTSNAVTFGDKGLEVALHNIECMDHIRSLFYSATIDKQRTRILAHCPALAFESDPYGMPLFATHTIPESYQRLFLMTMGAISPYTLINGRSVYEYVETSYGATAPLVRLYLYPHMIEERRAAFVPTSMLFKVHVALSLRISANKASTTYRALPLP